MTCGVCEYPFLRQGFQVEASIFYLKGFTKESIYYNSYKKPRVNLKEAIFEVGGQMRRRTDPKLLALQAEPSDHVPNVFLLEGGEVQTL